MPAHPVPPVLAAASSYVIDWSRVSLSSDLSLQMLAFDNQVNATFGELLGLVNMPFVTSTWSNAAGF